MIVKFQTKLSEELLSQTQEASSSGAKVNKHVITKRAFGEQRGHVKEVGRKVKGIRSSTATSHTSFAPGSSSGPTQAELATARAETHEYRQRLDVMEDSMCSMSQFVTSLQSQMPHRKVRCIIFSSPVVSYNFPTLLNSLI